MNSIIVWGYLGLCLLIGLMKFPKIKTLRQYAMGTSSFSTLILSLSMMAALIGTADTIGTAEKGFSMGAVFIITSVIQFARWYLMGKFVGPSIPYMRVRGCITLVDMMYFMYGKLGRILGVTSIFCEVFLLAIYYKAAAFILERYLGIDFKYAAFAITVIVAMYSVFGGMNAIIITDVLQFFIFVVCFPIIFIIGVMSIDISSLFKSLPMEKTHITEDNLVDLFTMSVFTLVPPVALSYIQRLLMCEGEKQAQLVCQVTGLFSTFFIFMMGTIGLISYGMNPDLKSDEALFYFIDYSVPPFIIGFVAISFLAVIMSTASSFLNSINVVIMKDIVTPLFPVVKKKKFELLITKIIGFLVVVVAYNMIFVKEHVLDTLWMLCNFYDPFITIPLLMALGGCRIKNQHYKYVVIITLTSLMIAYYFHGNFDTLTFTVGTIVSIISTFAFRDRSINKFDHSPEFLHKSEDVELKVA